MADNNNINMEINGQKVTAPGGVTVLRAAELNGFYIPTLCSHKDLSPYGGCRMCLVEIDGIRGYPLACSTTAADGMKVITDTVAIQEMRREILQLLLSEHPSSCLICDESEECKQFMGTIRKVGVTTGCRFCPNDDQCELQDVAEKLGVTDISYPMMYRHFEAEREDPFYDRDYNICILCGRCVRMCQEMRGTSVLAFTWRGSKAIVGPAFGRSHMEAGCEFCGACVSVCPTGALNEKASKWDGKPDDKIVVTCPYCGIGCQHEFWHKDGRFSKSLPVHDPEVNDGQACLKGRFCIGEVSHHFDRARKPMIKSGNMWKEITWDEAIEEAASKMKGLKPGEFSMLISPDCTNESLYTAQKFTRSVMGTNSIDSTARRSLGGGIGLWARLFRKPVSIQGISEAPRILAIGLDTRFNFSIVGVEIRKAMQKGAKLVTVDAVESNLARYANVWLQPLAGMEGKLLNSIVKGIKGKTDSLKGAAKAAKVDLTALEEASDILQSGIDLTVVIGPSVFGYSSNTDLVRAVTALARVKDVNIIPLYNGTNTRGAIEMGALAEILPGAAGYEDAASVKKLEDAWGTKLPDDEGITADDIVDGSKQPKVLYLVGAAPIFERPKCDYLIVQDIFEPDFECDLYLPAASFLESAGTLTNVEGRVQAAPRIEELPDSVQYGRARPDWHIFSMIAKKLGDKGFAYESADNIRVEISEFVRGFPKGKKLNRKSRKLPSKKGIPDPVKTGTAKTLRKTKLYLIQKPGGYVHRGVDITSKVEGLQLLNPEDGFFISPDDAAKLKIEEGNMITVKAGNAAAKAPARIDNEMPKGLIGLFVPNSKGGLSARKALEPLYNLEFNPHPVEVMKDDV